MLGANERVRLGFIGVANRGMQLLGAFLENPDVEIAALCDVAIARWTRPCQHIGGKAVLLADFRKLLDRKDIDAVVIATPDHWHAMQTIAACQAGKDVYVEKPLSITIHEGRRMVEVARQTKRVVQVGLHRRSSQLYAEAAEFVQAENLASHGLALLSLSNMYPNGIGHAQPSDSAGRPGLGHVAGPAAAASVPGEHRPLQVPLVAPLFVADRQPRRPLFRSHSLDDRRPGRRQSWPRSAAGSRSTTTAPFPTPWRRCSNRPPAG